MSVKHRHKSIVAAAIFGFLFPTHSLRSQSLLDAIGVTALRSIHPELVGTGVEVAQSEADASTDYSGSWQTNPAAAGLSPSLFSYISTAGTSSAFPNSLGIESTHADTVGSIFYGTGGGVAPGVSKIDSYYWFGLYQFVYYANNPNTPAISARVINQSWVSGPLVGVDPVRNPYMEQAYDNYIALNPSKVVVSGVGNDGVIYSPASSYNGIAVGAYGGATGFGPTTDGRSKPDITAPASATR